jgi:hypothetical protein
MRWKSSLRNLSLGVASAAFLAAGAAWALPGNSNSPTQSAQSGQSWLAGGTARLDHAVDSQNAKTGQTVEARLDHTVKTADGTELPGGTQLRGTVAAVTPSEGGGPSSITLRFDQAALKDGKTVPVKVTVIGAYPNDENQLAIYGEESMGSAQKHVPAQDRFDQEPGTLSHISMTSRVSGQNSATFSKKDGDVRLRAGTFLQVGIAPRGSGMTTSGA